MSRDTEGLIPRLTLFSDVACGPSCSHQSQDPKATLQTSLPPSTTRYVEGPFAASLLPGRSPGVSHA